MQSATVRSSSFDRLAPFAAPLLVGLVLSPLLVGYEPVGGDPDRIFRPIKTELARALKAGTLPFWSDKLGFGYPLLAESHAAALYPPNQLFYRLFDVPLAYRLSMWLHNVLIAAATFAYARTIGITPWGAALSGVAFALCGFQAIHSSHEWAYHTIAYFPLILICAEKYLSTGRLLWMALLALASGAAWTLGHFQMQTWGTAIVALVVLWRIVFDRRPFLRSVGVMVALMWGVLIAAAQLGPSWELAKFVGQENRDRISYAFPPAHFVELAFPQLFRSIDPEGAYWTRMGTTGYEVALYVGTIPLIFACVGVFARLRGVQVWKFVVALTCALATMPFWWRQGYEWFLLTPGIGLFRCPARWTVFASFGLALLAGAGFDASVKWRCFWSGVVVAIVFWVLSITGTFEWQSRPPVRYAIDFGIAPLAAAIGIASVLAWRWKNGSAPTVLILTAIELGFLYYNMTTKWGWPVRLQLDSPVFQHLVSADRIGLVGGSVDNLPVLAGLKTAEPYTGFRPIGNNEGLQRLSMVDWQTSRTRFIGQWALGRFGITHLVVPESDTSWLVPGSKPHDWLVPTGWLIEWVGKDAALSQLSRVRNPSNVWVVLRNNNPIVPDADIRTDRWWGPFERDVRFGATAHWHDQPNRVGHVGPIAKDHNEQAGTKARLLSWDGTRGSVRCDGWCAVVLLRAYEPNWQYRVDDGPWRRVISGDGGFQTLWFDLAGWGDVGKEVTKRFEVRYVIPGWPVVATASLVSTMLALGVAAWSLWNAHKR